MKARFLIASSMLLLFVASARAGDTEDNTLWITEVNHTVPGNYSDINGGWVVQIPPGSSDYFAVCFSVIPGLSNTEDVADGLPITGIGVSLYMSAGSDIIPRIGVYLPVFPGSCTPDLVKPLVEVFNVPVSGPLNGDYVFIDTPEAMIPPGTRNVIAAVQLPMSVSPFLGVGADSNAFVSNTSYFSIDAFSTPGIAIGFMDVGLSVGQDNSTTASCTVANRLPHGRLRVARGNATSGFGSDAAKGDRLRQHIQPGETLRLSFFGPQTGDIFLLTLMNPGCLFNSFLSGTIPTFADSDGDGSFQRLSFAWPVLFGAFDFSAVWGNFSCSLSPGVGFTNCVTVISP